VAEGDVLRGQQVWQTLGGMDVGSVWGHGSYVAPDWTADWLHREAVFLLEAWARAEHSAPFAELSLETQAALRARLASLMRANRYNPTTRTLTLETARALALESNASHYASVFRDGPSTRSRRERSRTLRGCGWSPAGRHALRRRRAGHRALRIRTPFRLVGPRRRGARLGGGAAVGPAEVIVVDQGGYAPERIDAEAQVTIEPADGGFTRGFAVVRFPLARRCRSRPRHSGSIHSSGQSPGASFSVYNERFSGPRR
jgi:hypothetical protein